MLSRRRKLVFSDHVVLDRLQQRGITRKDIRTALENSDTSYPGSRPKRGNLVKEGIAPNGRRLCVVVKEKRQHVVVSAWWKDA